MLNHSTSKAPPLLPADEAPPPYTPPRLLADAQNNMESIAEDGTSDIENSTTEVPKPRTNNTTQVRITANNPAASVQQREPIYDIHPAFDRRIVSLSDDTVKVTPRCMGSSYVRPTSPHTPPGVCII